MKLHYLYVQTKPIKQIEVVDQKGSIEGLFTFEQYTELTGVEIPANIYQACYEPDRDIFVVQYNTDPDPIKLRSYKDDPFLSVIHKSFEHIKSVLIEEKKRKEAREEFIEDWGNVIDGYMNIEA